jgi:hypothetical protein
MHWMQLIDTLASVAVAAEGSELIYDLPTSACRASTSPPAKTPITTSARKSA